MTQFSMQIIFHLRHAYYYAHLNAYIPSRVDDTFVASAICFFVPIILLFWDLFLHTTFGFCLFETYHNNHTHTSDSTMKDFESSTEEKTDLCFRKIYNMSAINSFALSI